MAVAVQILGTEGTGKTHSIRNLDTKSTYYINCDKKSMPFRGWRKKYSEEAKNYAKTSDPILIQKIIAGISKSQLDKGVSGSLFRDVGQLKQSLIRGYPQLKGKDLEFGYKLSFEGLSEEQSKTQLIEVKESKGFFEGLFGK